MTMREAAAAAAGGPPAVSGRVDGGVTRRSRGGVQEQSLNVLQHGLEYLKACYIPDPSGYGNQYGDVYVYQVGDVKRERRLWRRPEDITVRPPTPPPYAPHLHVPHEQRRDTAT